MVKHEHTVKTLGCGLNASIDEYTMTIKFVLNMEINVYLMLLL